MRLHIHRIPPPQRAQALAILYQDLPREERNRTISEMLKKSDEGDLDLDYLWGCWEGARIVAVLLAQPQPDGISFLWPPVVELGRNEETLGVPLLRYASVELKAAGQRYVQCLSDPKARGTHRILELAPISRLAELLYLERSCQGFEREECTKPEWRETCYSPEEHDRFVRVLDQTYRESLDCPGVSSTRSGREAIESHRLTGEFSPGHWKIYSVEGVDIGVLLLAAHPESSLWELVYLGVVPESRGRGYGKKITIDAICQVQKSGGDRLIVAVDSTNTYATNIYDSMGFRVVTRNIVHWASLPLDWSGISTATPQ